jgi:hypothetical protein
MSAYLNDVRQMSPVRSNVTGRAAEFFLRRRLLRGILEMLEDQEPNVRECGVAFASDLIANQLHLLFPIVPTLADKLAEIRMCDPDEGVRRSATNAIESFIEAVIR